jgi:protein-disulfide isomerase
VVKNFPLSSHRFAYQAAMAALAARSQGKYWEFHHELFKNYRSLNEEKINSIAEALQLNMQQFKQDRQSPVNRARIIEDLNDGRKAGVRGTPTVFMNGRQIENRQLSNLSQLITDELAGP